MLKPVLNQMLFLFTCILIGILLKKTHKLDDNASTVLSKLENEVIIPALLINSFSTNCSIASLTENVRVISYGLFFTLLQIILAIWITPFFTKDPSVKGIYTYSLAVVNFSFMGNSLVLGLFGNEMLFQYLMFSLPMQITIYSIGFVWLTAGKEKFTWKRLLNPTMISMVIGIVMGLCNIKPVAFIGNVLTSLSSCFAPIAMILTGLVIGGFDLKKLFSDKKIYLLTALRCILMPLIILSICKWIQLDQQIRLLLIFITAMPLGLNTIVFPAAYGGDTTAGASMAVISNLVGLISVPVFMTLFM